MKKSMIYVLLAYVSLVIPGYVVASEDSVKIALAYDKAVRALQNADWKTALEDFKRVLSVNQNSINMHFEDYEYKIRSAETIVDIYNKLNDDYHVKKYSKLIINAYERAFEFAKVQGMNTKALEFATILHAIFLSNGYYRSLDNKIYTIDLEPVNDEDHVLHAGKEKYYLNRMNYYAELIAHKKITSGKHLNARYLADEGFEKLKKFKNPNGSSVEGFDKDALENLEKSSILDPTQYDVEYELADMYFNGIGKTSKMAFEAQMHAAQQHAQRAFKIALMTKNNKQLIKQTLALQNKIDGALAAGKSEEKDATPMSSLDQASSSNPKRKSVFDFFRKNKEG